MVTQHACEAFEEAGAELGPVPELESQIAERVVVVVPGPRGQVTSSTTAWTGDGSLARVAPGADVSCPEFRSGRFLWFQAAFGAACDR